MSEIQLFFLLAAMLFVYNRSPMMAADDDSACTSLSSSSAPDSAKELECALDTKLISIADNLDDTQRKLFEALTHESGKLRLKIADLGLSPVDDGSNQEPKSAFVVVQMLIDGLSRTQINDVLQSVCPELNKYYGSIADDMAKFIRATPENEHNESSGSIQTIDKLLVAELCQTYSNDKKSLDNIYDSPSAISSSGPTWKELTAVHERIFPASEHIWLDRRDYEIVAELETSLEELYQDLHSKADEIRALIDVKNINSDRCNSKQLLTLKGHLLSYTGSKKVLAYLRHYYDRQTDLCKDLERTFYEVPMIKEELTLIVQAPAK